MLGQVLTSFGNLLADSTLPLSRTFQKFDSIHANALGKLSVINILLCIMASPQLENAHFSSLLNSPAGGHIHMT